MSRHRPSMRYSVNPMKRMNRRHFLRSSGAAAALAATPGLAYSQMMGGTYSFSDYRALVCVFLFGGNDSFNMLVPTSNAEYGAYAASRQNLAIAQDDLLGISTPGQGAVSYGLHPAMGGLKDLYESGSAAFIANVGPLLSPTTHDQFFDGTAPLPPQLFSHNDQQDQWASLRGRLPTKTGWAGRIADLIRDGVSGQRMATNASLFGANLLQSAEDTVAYVMGPGGPRAFVGFSRDSAQMRFFAQREAFRAIVEAEYNTVYERGFAEVQRRAIDMSDTVTTALRQQREHYPLTTAFPPSQLGTQLETVAYLIAARDALAMRRQVFFVAAGGFDSHDDQLQNQPGLLGDVSAAVSAFYSATVELAVQNNVTTFTQSDFGRTLTSNGDGTDHAWGGNQFVLGGSVAGRQLVGRYPVLEIGAQEDVGGGRFIPSTSADQYAATLARWFGIDDADLDTVAPSLKNFAQRNLGFMIA